MQLRSCAILGAFASVTFTLGGCPPAGGGGVNLAPLAVDQSVDIMIDLAQDITLVATDPDSGPQVLTFAIVTQPTNGTLSVLNGNIVTYTPDPLFAGLDHFTFTADDGADLSNQAEVCIEVTNNPQPGSFNDCTPIGGGADGGGNDGGGGGGDGSGGTVNLEIVIQGLTGNERNMIVSYFIDDVIRASTGNVSLAGGRRDCLTLDANQTTCNVEVEVGKTVTLFGLDGIGGGANVFAGNIIDPTRLVVSSNAFELAEIAGDCDSNPEAHACGVLMNADKSVTFTYRQMNSMIMALSGIPNALAYTIDSAPDTFGLPSFANSNVGVRLPINTALFTSSTPFLIVWEKTGTQLTFDFRDRATGTGANPPANDYSRYITWGGACNIVPGMEAHNPACAVTFNGTDQTISLDFEYFQCGATTADSSSDLGCPNTTCQPVPARACRIGPP